MAWTTPRTWVVGELVTASLMNAHVRDNLNYLLAGRANDVAHDTGSSTTTSTSYTDVDATNLTVTVTPKSSRVLVFCHLILESSGAAIGYAQIYGDNSAGTSGEYTVTNSDHKGICMIHPFTGLTPGTTYTFTAQFKSASGSVTIGVNSQGAGATMFAIEV